MKSDLHIRHSERGVALVVTLAILGLIVLLVMGFAVSMRTEQTAARTYSQTTLSRQLAAAAVDEAIFLIRTNTPAITESTFWVSQPGRIWSDTSTDDLLFSTPYPPGPTPASAGTTDLNFASSIIPSNSFYSVASNRRVEVGWVNVSPASSNIPPSTVEVDNTAAVLVGSWVSSTSPCITLGSDRIYHDVGSGASARFTPTLPTAGPYEVFITYFAAPNRATNTRVDINHAAGTTTVFVNQQAGGCPGWDSLGTYNFNAGTAGNVTFRNDGANGLVAADAVRFVGTGSSVSGPIIGRYAYWVDDEATKINVNQARARSSFFGTGSADIDLTILNGIGGVTATNSHTYATNVSFFTREHWKAVTNVGPTTYRDNQFYITAFAEDENLTPWGTARFNLNSATNVWKTEIDLGATNTLNHRALTNWFGLGNTFTNKYGANVLKQIMANMADFTVAAVGNNLPATGAQGFGSGPGQLDNGLAGTYGIPREYLGLRAHPFLNEIGVQATYWRPAGGNEIQCKLWFLVEMVNPYPFALGSGGQIRIHMDKLTYRVADSGGAWSYFCGFESGWVQNPACVGANPPYASPQETIFTIPHNIAAHSMTVFPIAVWSGNPETAPSAIIDQVYVRVNKIRYLQVANDELTVRDWAQIGDFNLRLAGGNHFTFLSPHISFIAGGVQPPFNNNLTRGLAKNDPRVRRFTAWSPPGTGTQLPWTPVDFDAGTPATIPSALGAENTGVVTYTGTVGNTPPFSNIPRDPVPTVPSPLAVTNHPSFYIKTGSGTAGGPVEVDNTAAVLVGSWVSSTSPCITLGSDRIYHDVGSGASARFTPTLPTAGPYEVFITYFAAPNRATNTRVDINHAAGTTTVFVNQQAGGCPGWDSLGTYNFNAGTAGNVTFRNDGANGLVAADAVRFVPVTTLTAATYESAVELGRIHTGLQWRTLMMQPRPSTEAAANLIPDWAALDIFGTSGGVARQPRININSVVTNFYTGNANWVPRTNVLSSLLTAITAANHLGFATDQGRIATNIHYRVWATGNTGNGWGAKRVAPFRFVPNMYSWVGELCEVDLIATNISPSTAVTNDWTREARLATFLNLVTTRSSHFTVHAIAQAIQDVDGNGAFNPSAGDRILGETLVEAVVERYGTAPGTANPPSYRVVSFRYLSD